MSMVFFYMCLREASVNALLRFTGRKIAYQKLKDQELEESHFVANRLCLKLIFC